MSELTAAHSTIEKAREVTNCPQGVELQEHLKKLVAESLEIKSAAKKVIKLNRKHAKERHGNADIAESWNYIKVLRKACSGTPATDGILREAEARARIEGINFAASRLAAAYNHGFIDKPLPEVFDVVRMILTAKEDLANTPAEDGLSGEYAEQALKDWKAELREGKA